jgi:cysteine-rich repeat protein
MFFMKKYICLFFTFALAFGVMAFGQTWECPEGEFVYGLDCAVGDGDEGGDGCTLTLYCAAAGPPPPPECGDGVVNQPGETCDPPGSPTPGCDVCRDTCTYCGDGIVDPEEECDDGNCDNGDGCDSNCEMEPGAGYNDIKFYGLVLKWYPGWGNCPTTDAPNTMTFRIAFHAHDNGWPPGAPIWVQNFAPGDYVAENMGLNYSGFLKYRWTIDPMPGTPQEECWLAIDSDCTQQPDQCWFMWSGSPDGNGFSYQEGYGARGDDLAYKLTKNGVNSFEQCEYLPSESWIFITSDQCPAYRVWDDHTCTGCGAPGCTPDKRAKPLMKQHVPLKPGPAHIQDINDVKQILRMR